jgi:hypothetical protein
MAQTCTKCSRVNPAEASYCYYDGSLLEGHSQNGGAIRAGTQSFPNHFVFPSGLICRNFDQLAQACQENWPSAVELLQQGYLENFFGGLGRADLAFAARESSRFPDRDRGLDQLLAKLPSQVLEPPKLHAEPREVNLGIMQVGNNQQFKLHLANNGSRLLYGTVTCDDCKWLTLGDAPGTSQKVFQFGTELEIPVQIRGASLRAGTKPLEGRLLVESNGGNSTVVVRCEVPVRPFAEGVLAGAKSPRQIAEKAKAAPKEAAVLFEKGAVADWYKANGWIYPVQGPSAAGLGAVQQFFEALGLTAPPKVEISERSITFHGEVGQRLSHTLEVKAQEKRPVFAHGTSDQPWLVVERAQLNGRTATIAVTVPSVPNRGGETLQGRVTVTSNGNQRFVVPVTLTVSGAYVQPILVQDPMVPIFSPQPMDFASPVIIQSPASAPVPYVTPQVVQAPPSPIQPGMPMPVYVQAEPAPAAGRRRQQRHAVSPWVHFLPALLLTLVLLGMVFKDMIWGKKEEEEVFPVSTELQVQPLFHDQAVLEKELDVTTLKNPTMRFGIVMPQIRDPKGQTLENDSGKLRLTYFARGYSNNTVIRVDNTSEYFFGNTKQGRWLEERSPLGKTPDGRVREGLKSVMYFDSQKIKVTQIVEVVPNDQPAEVVEKGKTVLKRLLDQCLIRYEIENLDDKPHTVGLRFMLDTFIGTNDGVPFTIPGQTQLVQDARDFDPDNIGQTQRDSFGPALRDPTVLAPRAMRDGKPAAIPDFIQALENPSLDKPGIIARVTLNLGSEFERPQRVTLGAWPHNAVRTAFTDEDGAMASKVNQLDTRWDVPVLSMKTMVDRKVQGKGPQPLNDSCVVIYWPELLMEPKGKPRELGFMYGLGDLSGTGGRLALTVGTRLKVNQEFPVTALVNEPQPGQTVTLELPKGFALVEGQAKQQVPPAAAGAEGSKYSPVTWRVRATIPQTKFIRVHLDGTGTEAKRLVTIRSQSTFN